METPDLSYSLAAGIAIIRPLTPRERTWAERYFHEGNVEVFHDDGYEITRRTLPAVLRAARTAQLLVSGTAIVEQ